MSCTMCSGDAQQLLDLYMTPCFSSFSNSAFVTIYSIQYLGVQATESDGHWSCIRQMMLHPVGCWWQLA